MKMAEENLGNNELYACIYCEKYLKSEKSLEKHVKFHENESSPFEETEPKKKPRIKKSFKSKDKYKVTLNEGNFDKVSPSVEASPSLFKKKQISDDMDECDEEASSKELQNSELAEKLEILKSVLKDNFDPYLKTLRRHFEDEIDKESFYEESERFFTSETIVANTEFLRAFFGEIYADTRASFASKNCSHSWLNASGTRYCKNCHMRDIDCNISSVRTEDQQKDCRVENSFTEGLVNTLPTKVINFEHVSTKGYLRTVETAYHGDGIREHASRMACLPDVETMYGLIYITAWERGLNLVDRLALPVMTTAVEIHLKRIVTAILMRRNSYTMQTPVYFGKENDEQHAKCFLSGHPKLLQRKAPVSVEDVLDAIQVYPHVLPLRSLHTRAISKIMARLPIEGNSVPEKKGRIN